MTAPPTDVPDLLVRQMRVIWRDTFIAAHAGPGFLHRARAHLRSLPCYLADSDSDLGDQPELLRIINRVSRSVARGGHGDLLRVELAPFQLANLRPALARWRCSPDRLKPAQIKTAAVEADAARAWIQVTPVLVLHRAGVGIMAYYADIDAPDRTPHRRTLAGESLSGVQAADDVSFVVARPYGYSVEECIELVRLGIQTELLSLPDAWRDIIPPDAPQWSIYNVVGLGPDANLAVGGLRDFSQIIAAHLENQNAAPRRRRSPQPVVAIRPPRPTGSTTVILTATDPAAGDDLAAFVQQYAYPLRGIGAMDSYYHERAAWIVERELGDNLSSDTESVVYLLGNSELILFNHQLPGIVQDTRRRLGLSTADLAAAYIFMHYGVLLEWVYLQDAILRAYIQRLDALAASTPPRRREMIATLHGALADLIQYQENITPYATRIDFLERARRYHKLDELAERFERKQDLLLSYSSEYYDYREARAAEFLNWLAAILAGGELGNLIVNAAGIAPGENVPLYLSVTLGSIGLAFAVMLVIRVLSRR